MRSRSNLAEDVRVADLLGLSRNDLGSGFYIDVGAWHPRIDNITAAFHEAGWWGINIEPNPFYHAQLAEDRPNDINLQVALSDVPGAGMFTVIGDTGLSTFRAEYAALWTERHPDHREIEVRMTTLAAVCDRHVPRGVSIDFCKIDVEGWERQVIRGADWMRYRPKVLVIEATVPGTEIPAWSEWEGLVVDAGYTLQHFDGINRFYTAS